MSDATAQVLFDIATLGVAALAIGLPIFAFVRRRDTEVGWHYHGNVWTEPFDHFDLLAAGLLIFYFYLGVATPVLLAGGTEESEKTLGKISPTAIIAFDLMFKLSLGAGVFAFITVLRRRDPVQLFGLTRLPLHKVLASAAVAMVPVYLAIAAVTLLIWKPLFEHAWNDPGTQEIVKMLMESNDAILKAFIVLSAVVVAPLFEELVFRGVIYPVLKRYSDRFFAAIITSLMFAAVHGSVPALLPLFVLALLLTAAYEFTGCLWVPVAMHALFNGINTLFMLNNPVG